MDRCVDRLLADDSLDLVLSAGLPLGLNSKAIRARAISLVREHRVTEKNDHGFILFFTATGLCSTAVIRPCPQRMSTRRPESRSTMKTICDSSMLCTTRYDDGPSVRGGEIVAALREHPSLVDINTHLSDEYWNRSRALLNLQYRSNGKVLNVVQEP